MKKITFILLVIVGISSAFIITDREPMKFNAESVKELLYNNGNISPSNTHPDLMDALKHTWIAPKTEDGTKIVLYSNHAQAQEVNCDFVNYYFQDSNLVNRSNYNYCDIATRTKITVDTKEKLLFTLSEENGKTFINFADEAGTDKGTYQITEVAKVTYINKIKGYEITLIKE